MAAKKAPAKKKTAPKKEVEPQETQPVEKEEVKAVEKPQEEESSKEKAVKEKRRERKAQRVITILSSDDSAFLSRFSLPRSSVSRAVLVGCRGFLEQFAEKKDVTEAEIVDALTAKLK